jgi:type II secretory pathway component PulK
MNVALIMAMTLVLMATLSLGAITIRRLDEIHEQVNGNLHKVRQDLAEARELIVKLQSLLPEAKVQEAKDD